MDKLINIPKIKDLRGSLCFLEANNHIPFNISSFHVLNEKTINDFSFNINEQYFILPLYGQIEITVNVGDLSRKYKLEKNDCGLYLPYPKFMDLNKISKDANVLVISSRNYYLN